MRLLLGILIWTISSFATDSFTGRVVHVTDGDTLTVDNSGQLITVRLLGVDAPEKRQEGGDAASRFTRYATLDRTVQVIEHYFDRDGRMVAEIVLPDGRLLNRELVGAGHAWWWPKYAPHDAELERLEIEAREQRRGLWAFGQPMPPWEWRKIPHPVSRADLARRRSDRAARRYGYHTRRYGYHKR